MRVLSLEKEEQERHLQNRHKKIVAAEAKLITQQQNQMAALRKRIEAAESEQRKQREQEHDKLLQRYQNLKKELENQQNLERIKLDGGSGKRPSTSHGRSVYSTSSPGGKKKGGRRAANQPASKPSQ